MNGEQESNATTNNTISAGQFDLLMGAIASANSRVEGQLAEFREEIKRGQEDVAAKALKRVKLEKPYNFRKKGNEEQANFNSKLEDALAETEAHLADAPATVTSTIAVTRARDILAKGMKLLGERQKLIKLADRSDYGWGVVSEYTADELADDSDDEKKIEKAEKAAERKALKKKKKRPIVTQLKGPSRIMASALGTVATGPSAPTVIPAGRRVPLSSTISRPLGPCFSCGEIGHLRAFCPKPSQTADGKPKWYPFTGISVNKGRDKCSPTLYVEHDQCDVSHASNEVNEWGSGDVDNLYENELSCPFEIETGDCNESQSCPSVKGRLRDNIQFWKDEFESSQYVLQIIENGYVLPLKSPPTSFSQKNHASALENREFVGNSFQELLTTNCICQVHDPPFVCSPLSVVESSKGKKRLVINLRHLNKFLWKPKFKYEDLRIAMLLLQKGDFLFSFDLKSGYHHIEIVQIHQKYLGFEWDGSYYIFTDLPFGLSTACYVLTKMLRPLIRYWRARGLRIMVYLDNGLGAAVDFHNTSLASLLVRPTLEKAGFIVHPTKCIWQPTQRLQWLGFIIDIAASQLEVPQDKLLALRDQVSNAISLTHIKPKLLASIIGKIISMGLALGPVSRFMTRNLYALLESRLAWCQPLVINDDAKGDLKFWVDNLQAYNAQPIWHSPAAMHVVYSDASDTGYGGYSYSVEHGPLIAYGQWSAEEAQQSST